MPQNQWFEVDKEGLAKLMERKDGKAFLLYELYQNAWDEDTKRVDGWLTPIENRAACRIKVVDDNPNGFRDLTHAFTLFAESYKKDDPTKRGRFNAGEKQVLALCEEATISTTTGTVYFNADGTRRQSSKKTATGSVFEAVIRMTRAEYDGVAAAMEQLLPPDDILSYFNGKRLGMKDEFAVRKPVAQFPARLVTEMSDDKGILRRPERNTFVRVFEVMVGETAMLYEMGIPVVETNDKYHVDVQQKVPLNIDRDNVPPSYLRTLRTLVLNEMHAFLVGEEETNAPWVRDALEDENVAPAAVKKVVSERFGDDAVAYDPSDPEGTKISMSQGRQVIYGGSFSGEAWKNIQKAGVAPRAGLVTPSPKPYGDGPPLKLVDEWTDGMQAVANYASMLAKELMGVYLNVRVGNDSTWPFNATYGKGGDFTFNVGRLGHRFFDDFPNNILDVDRLIVHEFGHEFSSDHFSKEYHDALCKLAAKLKRLCLDKPELVKQYMLPSLQNA